MKRIHILLISIIILSAVLRIYRLDVVPPSISWDEAAVGVNAWTIANWGRDEYGKIFPLYFQSFGEDKQPIHIYITSLSVKILGLSEFATRFPTAIFGVFNVIVIFYLAKILFNNNFIALSASFFFAISPQNIFFSRFNHEANFALFFFMLGLLLFYKALKKGNLLIFWLLSFFLSMISYHAAEIVVPPITLLLVILYFKRLKISKFTILAITFLFMGFVISGILQPRLFGISRFNQTVQGRGDIERTEVFKKTHSYFLGRINLALTQYFWHLDPNYLFISGGKNSRLSSQGSGEFYKIDAIFLILGLGYLLYKRSRAGLLVFSWALIGPLPSSLFAEAPHAGRAAFMMGSWHIIAALGFFALVNFFKRFYLKWIIGSICIITLLISLTIYLKDYFNEFPKRYAIDWQYGMEQIVEYVQSHPEYPYVFMTDVRSQPYIFFLYYLKIPLPEFLGSAVYNRSESRSYNTVASFGKFYFGGWNPVKDTANREMLYILTPSEYDGLVNRSSFNVKKVIYYPNGATAFYIVSIS